MKRTVYALILAMLAGMLTFGGVSAQSVFKVGDEVISQGGPLELYTRPGGGTRLTEMPDGTVTEIVAGPEIVDGVAWWYITNNYGWVAGERDGQPALVPFEPAMLDRTIAEASTTITSNPNDADAYFRRGWAYFNQKAYDSAISDLTQAITLEPDNSALYHARGTVYLDDNKFEQAITDLTIGLSYSPDDITAYNLRGLAYYNLVAHQQATQDYSIGLQLAPDYGLLYYNFANVASATGSPYLALDYFEQALTIDLNLHQVHYLRGFAYYDVGDYDSAMVEFEKTLEYYPEEYYAYAGFGIVYEARGELETALDNLNRALEIAPENFYLYRRRGTIHYRLSRFVESKADFAQAVEFARDPGNEYNTIGGLYRRLQDYPAAIESFTKAIEVGYSRSYWAIYNRGLVYKDMREYDKALADFKAALDIQIFPAPYIEQAEVFYHMSHYDEALEILNQTIEMFPSLSQAYAARGNVYDRGFGEMQKALDDYLLAAQLDPYEPRYLHIIGNMYFNMGKEEDAIRAYEEYVALVGEANANDSVLDTLESLRFNQQIAEENRLDTAVISAPVQDHYATTGQILYLQRDYAIHNTAIYLLDRNGTPTALTPQAEIPAAAWLPDGQGIVFADGDSGLYLITPDGAQITRIASQLYIRRIAVSHDGKRVAYSVNDDVWVVGVDGSNNMNLTGANGDYDYYGANSLDWSPDSQRIIFNGSPEWTDTPRGVLQIDADGTNFKVIVPAPSPGMKMKEAKYSPDGRSIAFLPDVPEALGVWIYDVDTGYLIKFDSPGAADLFEWSPDGTHIVFVADGKLFVVEIATAIPPLQIAVGVLETQSRPSWLPDSQHIAFQACMDEPRVCQVFTIRADGSELTQLTDNAYENLHPMMSPLVE